MLLAMKLKARKPNSNWGYTSQLKSSPEKNKGIKRKRFLAQSLGRSNFK
jgi:hypothetical protein